MVLFSGEWVKTAGPSPAGQVSGPAVFVHSPENSTILGAAKVTGRTRGGLQVGLLDAVTRSERALVQDTAGERFTEQVEPASNYFVGRVKRNYRGGNATVGAIGHLGGPPVRLRRAGAAPSRPRRGAGGGLGDVVEEPHLPPAGQLRASPARRATRRHPAAAALSARYFQRPDRASGGNGIFSDLLDPAATALRGYGGYLRMAKDAGEWRWEGAVNYRSPGFEVNDIAFLTARTTCGRWRTCCARGTQPTSWYRNWCDPWAAQQQVQLRRRPHRRAAPRLHRRAARQLLERGRSLLEL